MLDYDRYGTDTGRLDSHKTLGTSMVTKLSFMMPVGILRLGKMELPIQAFCSDHSTLAAELKCSGTIVPTLTFLNHVIITTNPASSRPSGYLF